MFSGLIYTLSATTLRPARDLLRYPLTSILILISGITLAFAAPANAGLDIIPVDQVHEGMKGTGRTVFHGLEITEFPVEVQGVLPGAGMSGETLIIVKLTAPEAEDHGGVSMGMSGSPIFINGKLAGALALTFPMTDHRLGGVTPIEAMIKAGEYQVGSTTGKSGDDEIVRNLDNPFIYEGRRYDRVRYRGELLDGELSANPVMAPVAVQGITARSYGLVKKLFENNGVEMAPITTAGTALKSGGDGIGPGSDIKPGSSVAVQLVRGDVDISAVGTVTAVDGDKVYMFGHPFFRKGDVQYLIADAHVIAIVQGDDMPFKMSTTGLLRGMALQDRGSALVGKLDAYPTMIPLEITAVDTDINRSKTVKVKIVPDEDILANLVLMVTLETLDNAIDKIGEGTSKISFSVNAAGYDGEISRENMYYDRFDVSSASLTELAQAVMMLYDNRFYESPITSVKVRAEISSQRSVAAIEKVKLVDWKSVAPKNAAFADEVNFEESEGAADADAEESEATESAEVGGEEDIRANAPQTTKSDKEKKYDSVEDIPEDSVEIEFERNDEEEDETIPIVYPGDKLSLGITVRPFRSETVEETIFLRVPKDMEPGTAHIKVFSGNRNAGGMSPGGFTINIQVEGPETRDQQDDLMAPEDTPEDSFDDVIKEFLDQEMNNELIATIEKFGFGMDDDVKRDEEEADVVHESQDGRAKKKTQWVLSGNASVKVKIGSLDGQEGFKSRKVIKSRIGSLNK